MRRLITLAASLMVITLSLTLPTPALAKVKGCSLDSVQSGPTCIDKYEASVWSISAAQTGLIALVKKGTATLADLSAGGATQIGLANSCAPVFPVTFPDTGNWTAPLYAVSIPGVHPTACITWFQAEQACRLSGKRLLTNQEWQAAAAGTPDTGGADNGTTTCNTDNLVPGPSNTGSRSACVSNFGAFDMVGNVAEWVADWTPTSTACPGWGGFSDDENCFAGASATFVPSALIRGGRWFFGSDAGVFAVGGLLALSNASSSIGFRCAR